MKRRIIELIKKYRQQIAYLIVGCCTTAVNYIIYAAITLPGGDYLLANVIAWVGAVAFAYFANGRFVYREGGRRSLRQAGEFVLSRLFSLGLETLCLWLLVEQAHVGKLIAKIAVAVMVVVVNYLTGLLVYRKR